MTSPTAAAGSPIPPTIEWVGGETLATAGADFGLVEAVRRDIFHGPRLFIAGHALSQTGGHGDHQRTRSQQTSEWCGRAEVEHDQQRNANGEADHKVDGFEDGVASECQCCAVAFATARLETTAGN